MDVLEKEQQKEENVSLLGTPSSFFSRPLFFISFRQEKLTISVEIIFSGSTNHSTIFEISQLMWREYGPWHLFHLFYIDRSLSRSRLYQQCPSAPKESLQQTLR